VAVVLGGVIISICDPSSFFFHIDMVSDTLLFKEVENCYQKEQKM